MLTNFLKNCKLKVGPYEKDIILIIIIFLVALISFGLGRLSKIGESRAPITIENLNKVEPLTGQGSTLANKTIVASKNGTKYHYVWCSGASTIKEENKVYFSTVEEARSAGYTPAANCKGLK
jgi:hypothetical protein